MEPIFPRHLLWFARALALAAFVAGCKHENAQVIDASATLPPGVMPAPNGTFTGAYLDLQAFKGQADDFVIYEHEWYMGGQQLGPRGAYHAREILKRLADVPFPVVIQETGQPELNETRRKVIVDYLAANGVPNAANRVVIDFPEAEGLSGDEAELYYRNLLRSSIGRGGAYGGGAQARFSQGAGIGPGGVGGGQGALGGGLGGLGGVGGPIGGRPGPFGY